MVIDFMIIIQPNHYKSVCKKVKISELLTYINFGVSFIQVRKIIII